MAKLNQEQRVVLKLKRDGYITRNECLSVYISRLSSIILKLKNKGWDFETKDVKGDYVYTTIKTPFKVTTYVTERGETIKIVR